MQQATKEEWLRGVKCIADFLGVDESTVRRWAKARKQDFPVRRFGGRWVAHTGELRAWMGRAA